VVDPNLTELGREDRAVDTAFFCVGFAPIVGAQNIPFSVPVTMNYPLSVKPNATFNLDSVVDALEVPTNLDAFTINNFNNLVIAQRFSLGATLVSAELVPDSALYIPPGGGPPQNNLPGGTPTINYNSTTRRLVVSLPRSVPRWFDDPSPHHPHHLAGHWCFRYGVHLDLRR
jgi:hypothetical protein